MKTNQLMEVAFKHGVIKIKHKALLGSLKDVEVVGNLYRAEKGLKPKSLKKWLENKDTWEFIATLNKRTILKENGFVVIKNSSELIENADKNQREEFLSLEYQVRKDVKNVVAVSEMIKKYPDYLIKSQRGGKVENRGVWANLYILVKFAMWLDKDFEIDVIDTFINKNILKTRDDGGNYYKALNIVMDYFITKLPPKPQRYIIVANKLNKQINKKFSKGWNDKESELQEARKLAEHTLMKLVDMGFIKTYKDLLEAIEKL